MISSHVMQKLEDEVRKAGEVLLSYWPGREGGQGQDPDRLGARKKGDGSYVTEADFASNNIVVSAISKFFPGDVILSEELPPDTRTKSAERLWVIDPLDGTQSFMNGNDDFSILVALCHCGVPEMSMMYFPARGQMATAMRGGGAYVNGTMLGVSAEPQPRPQSVYARHCTLSPAEWAYPTWLDSGCAFLTLARGEFDGLVIKIVNHREWDLAAPALVVEESGGRVSDEHGRPIKFNEGKIEYQYFVASNGSTHQALLDSVAASAAEESAK